MASPSCYICHTGNVFLVSVACRLPAHSQVDRRGSDCEKMGRQRGSSRDRRLRGETHSSSQSPGFPISARAAGELGRAACAQTGGKHRVQGGKRDSCQVWSNICIFTLTCTVSGTAGETIAFEWWVEGTRCHEASGRILMPRLQTGDRWCMLCYWHLTWSAAAVNMSVSITCLPKKTIKWCQFFIFSWQMSFRFWTRNKCEL